MVLKIEGFEHIASGKVRELYILEPQIAEKFGSNILLMVSTDRISAFDYILEPEIPNKGEILTQITNFQLKRIENIVPNHLLENQEELLKLIPENLRKRSVFCKKLDMFPVEAVVRGYLTGSAFLEYQKTGKYLDINLPAGLEDGAKLEEPIFTPAMKAEVGEHDVNVEFKKVEEKIGAEYASKLRELSIAIFKQASEDAKAAGLTLVDTKFEFGLDEFGQITIGDEVLTPDSSRYLDSNGESVDKQFVRSFLLKNWNRETEPKPPKLPEVIVQQTRERYIQTYEKLTRKVWDNEK